MRWLCIALLAANLGYYAWSMHADLARGTASVAPPVTGYASVGTLKLLSELETLPPERSLADQGEPDATLPAGQGSASEATQGEAGEAAAPDRAPADGAPKEPTTGDPGAFERAPAYAAAGEPATAGPAAPERAAADATAAESAKAGPGGTDTRQAASGANDLPERAVAAAADTRVTGTDPDSSPPAMPAQREDAGTTGAGLPQPQPQPAEPIAQVEPGGSQPAGASNVADDEAQAVPEGPGTTAGTPGTAVAANPAPEAIGVPGARQEDAAQTEPPSAACLRVGPMVSERNAASIERWFRSRGAGVHLRSEDQPVKTRFWVYLEPQASEEVAKRQVQALKEKGVKDYLLIQKGDMKNAISLGLFSSQDAVNRRLAELKDRGLKPVVVPRYETKKQYWVDIRLARNDPLAASDAEALPGETRFNRISCDEIAAEAGASVE